MPRSKEVFNNMRTQTRQKIETTALSLFARKGLSVPVSEIAQKAGLSQGLMYSHYPSKDALIMELIKQATEISGQAMYEIVQENNTAVEKINRITDMLCNMFLSANVGIEYFMFMLQVNLNGFHSPNLLRKPNESHDPAEMLTQIIIQGQSEGTVLDGNPEMLAITYWAAVQGICCYKILGLSMVPTPNMLSHIILKENNKGE